VRLSGFYEQERPFLEVALLALDESLPAAKDHEQPLVALRVPVVRAAGGLSGREHHRGRLRTVGSREHPEAALHVDLRKLHTDLLVTLENTMDISSPKTSGITARTLARSLKILVKIATGCFEPLG
jgi:hypothetical protein